MNLKGNITSFPGALDLSKKSFRRLSSDRYFTKPKFDWKAGNAEAPLRSSEATEST